MYRCRQPQTAPRGRGVMPLPEDMMDRRISVLRTSRRFGTSQDTSWLALYFLCSHPPGFQYPAVVCQIVHWRKPSGRSASCRGPRDPKCGRDDSGSSYLSPAIERSLQGSGYGSRTRRNTARRRYKAGWSIARGQKIVGQNSIGLVVDKPGALQEGLFSTVNCPCLYSITPLPLPTRLRLRPSSHVHSGYANP
jgi:hypothetical protein